MAKIYRGIAILILLCIPGGVYAATLSYSPASGSYTVGKTFTVGIYAGSADQAMNAASGVVSFPPDKLQVVSISKAGSIFSVWVQEPSYSNTVGTVSFEGIILNPGYKGASGKILTVTFKVKAAGTASITFSSSSALANDGLGTNILKGIGTAKFVLGNAIPATKIAADTEKPSYFDVLEVPRTDPTEPRATFMFNASDDIGIDHYEIAIDGGEEIVWKDIDTPRYTAPPYGPGKHTIVVKAVDKAGNARSATADFVIKGLKTPVFTEYPQHLQTEEVLSVNGTTYANGDVRIWFRNRKDEPMSHTVKADAQGRFMFISDNGLDDGVYEIWAEAFDVRGARSLPSDKLTIVVSKSAVVRIGGFVVSVLSVIVPLIVLIIALIFILLYLWQRLSSLRRRVHKSVGEAETAIHQSFDTLRNAGERNVVPEAEKFIEKQIENIDKSV
jgi:hypothetical protein